MFTIITNYKKMFLMTLKNDFGVEGVSDKLTVDDFNKKEPGEDLKALRKALKDGINSEEAKIISKSIDNIEGEAKIGLKEVVKSMLDNGFNAIDEKTYNSFKNLINNKAVGSDIKLPSWKELEDTLGDNQIGYIRESSFHGVIVRNDHIQILYDGFGTEDTLEIKNINGKYDLDNPEWKSTIGEENDVRNGEANKRWGDKSENILDDQISSIEKEKTDLEEAKNNFGVLLSSIKDFKNNNKDSLNKYNIVITNLESTIDIDTASIKDIEDEQIRLVNLLDKVKQELDNAINMARNIAKQNKENEYKNIEKELITWNKGEFTEKGVKLIQEKLGFTGKDLDGKFGPKTLGKVKEIASDGKIGLGVLKKLGLVDKDNNAINGLTKDSFKPGQLEKGNSSRIIFKENVTVKEEVKKETSTFEQIKKWFKEVFTSEDEVTSFIGINGEKIDIVFNDANDTLALDTPYFDGISDYDLKNIPTNINSVEEAKVYLKENIVKVFKEEYDAKVMKKAISEVQEVSETSSSYVVGNFEYKIDGENEQLKVKLHNDIDTSDTITGGESKIDGYYVEVDTLVGDGVSDSETKVLIKGEPTTEKVNKVVEEAKDKYKEKRNEIERKEYEEQDKKDWGKAQEEFDNVDIGETEFDKEIEERGLEDLELSEEDMKVLKEAEDIHIDLSDIEKQDDGSYLIDIDGSMNLVVKKIDNGYHFTSDSGDFIFTDQTVNNMKDAIISGTKQLNEYKKTHKRENTYDPTKVTRKR